MATVPLETTPRVNSITRQIIGAAMKVHTLLGPGLLESAYNACLVHELRKRGLRVESQVALPVVYDGEKIELGYRIDLVVADSVIVEIQVRGSNQSSSRSAASLVHAPERQASGAAHQLPRATSARRD